MASPLSRHQKDRAKGLLGYDFDPKRDLMPGSRGNGFLNFAKKAEARGVEDEEILAAQHLFQEFPSLDDRVNMNEMVKQYPIGADSAAIVREGLFLQREKDKAAGKEDMREMRDSRGALHGGTIHPESPVFDLMRQDGMAGFKDWVTQQDITNALDLQNAGVLNPGAEAFQGFQKFQEQVDKLEQKKKDIVETGPFFGYSVRDSGDSRTITVGDVEKMQKLYPSWVKDMESEIAKGGEVIRLKPGTMPSFREFGINVENTGVSLVEIEKLSKANKVPAPSARLEPFDAKTPSKAKKIATKLGEMFSSVSQQTKVPVQHLMAIAKAESGFNPDAKNKLSSATGLFQFTKGTWKNMVGKYGKQYGVKMGDIRDPTANTLMAAQLTRNHQMELQSTLGREPGIRELYLAHFAGISKAKKVLRALEVSPNMPASTVFTAAEINANPALLRNKTIKQAFEALTNKVARRSR